MKLIYHPRSPYSRKAYIVALQTGHADSIALEEVVVAPVVFPGWSDNVPDVAKYNPLAKLPTLVLENGETGIFDSRTICDWLVAHSKVPATDASKVDDATKWRLRTLHAASDGMLDAMVLLVYENRIRAPKGLKLQAWEDGQNEKIQRGFDFLEAEAKAGVLDVKGADIVAEAAVGVVSGCFDSMKTEWRSTRPALAKWFDEYYSKRDVYTSTRAEIDWKTGKDVTLKSIEDRAAAKI